LFCGAYLSFALVTTPHPDAGNEKPVDTCHDSNPTGREQKAFPISLLVSAAGCRG
jgi:hypothetical protein